MKLREVAADPSADLVPLASRCATDLLASAYREHRQMLGEEPVLERVRELYSVQQRLRSVILLAEVEGSYAGGVAAVDGNVALEDPVGLLHTLDAGTAPGAFDRAGTLLEAITDLGLRRGWRSLRAQTVPDYLTSSDNPFTPARGWELVHLGVRKLLQDPRAPEPRPDGVRVREATRSDLDFVTRLIGEAMWMGFKSFEQRRYGRPALLSQARRIVTELLSSQQGRVLVAEQASGDLLGHTSLRLEQRRQLTGWREAVLLDTWVLESAAGQGLATHLNAHAEGVAFHAGYRFIYGTINAETPAQAMGTLEALWPSGWQPADLQFVKNLV